MHESLGDNAAPLAPIEDSGDSTAAFVVVEGRLSNNRIRISQTLATLGSDPSCDIWLPYPEIRPLHAIMAKSAHGWSIRGLDSSFAIAINGKTVQLAPVSVSPGDRLGIGRLILEFNDHSSFENIKLDITGHHRLHAASLAAQHIEALEQRWAVELKERSLIRRAKRIASRLTGLNERHTPATAQPSPTDTSPQWAEPLQDREEKMELEKARLARLRMRLLMRWKKLKTKPQPPNATPDEKHPRNGDPLAKHINSPKLKIHAPDLSSATPDAGLLALDRDLFLLQQRKSDLLLEIQGLARKAERLRAETQFCQPSPPSSPAEGVLLSANLMAQHHAEWDQDAAATIKALEKELITLAEREHLIAEREALLENLLGQRHRQREELDLCIYGAAKETRLATIRAEESEIEANRLRQELEQLNEAWDRRTAAPAKSTSNLLPEAWQDLGIRLDRLTETLGKAADWACQDLDASERAELEFLRFNSIINGLPPTDMAVQGIRAMVDSVCDEIRNSLIPGVNAFIRANQSGSESPDRRLVIEAHRWKIRSEALSKALMETRALLQKQDRFAGEDRSNRAA